MRRTTPRQQKIVNTYDRIFADNNNQLTKMSIVAQKYAKD